jgi:transposase
MTEEHIRHTVRTQFQIEQECDEILHLMVDGDSNKQIMEKRNLPERTFYDYQNRLKERIIAEQMEKRHEEIMLDKQIVKDRLTEALQLQKRLWNDEHISSRTRMDAGTRYAEIAVALLKLETEMLGFMHALNESRLQQPTKIQLPKPEDTE